MQPPRNTGRTPMNCLESRRERARSPRALLPMLALLGLLLSACAAPLQVPASSSVPPLPVEARPSQCPRPSVCQESCSKGVSTLLDSLTASLPVEKPASAATAQ